jgi:hypothetical protein
MPIEPTFAEVISGAIESRLLDLHTCMPGIVTGFDAIGQSVNVQPAIKRAINTYAGELEHEELPIVHNVPLAFPGGGGYVMRFPVTAGDHVWLMFSEAAMSQWRTTGQVSEPGDLRRHDLSYACAMYLPFGTVVEATEAAADPLLPPTAARMDCPSPFTFGNQVSGQFVALATLVSAQLTALKTAISSAPTTVGDGGAAFKAGIVSALSAWPATVAATKLKAE